MIDELSNAGYKDLLHAGYQSVHARLHTSRAYNVPSPGINSYAQTDARTQSIHTSLGAHQN